MIVVFPRINSTENLNMRLNTVKQKQMIETRIEFRIGSKEMGVLRFWINEG